MIMKVAFGTIAVFLLSLVWLLMTWLHENRSATWEPVVARVVEMNTYVTVARGKWAGYTTSVDYDFNGQSYSGEINDYISGDAVQIYVNPLKPDEHSSFQGATIKSIGLPLILTVGSAAVLVVLLLIKFSPKED